tara:strand:- start:9688 stop:11580 length:1893 start_codon:yes stop_codon:yes gene_type:complete
MARGEELLDFQLRRIRFALFQAYSYKQLQIDSAEEDRPREASSVAWHEIAESINHSVGVEASRKEKENFGERLRAFVIGNTNQETGKVVRTTPQRIDDIIFYLLQEETYLTKSELENFIPDQQAAIRVHEFLDPEYDVDAGPVNAQLDDEYVTYRFDPGGMLEVSSLSLKYVPYISHYAVHEHIWRYDCNEIDSDGLDELHSKLQSSLKHKHLGPGDDVYSGWAIEAYDGNFVIFLQDQQVDQNKFYLALYNDPPDSDREDRRNRLVLIERFSPLYFLRKENKRGHSPAKLDLTKLSDADLVNYIHTEILPQNLRLFRSGGPVNETIDEINKIIINKYLKKSEKSDSIKKEPKIMFWSETDFDSKIKESSSAEEVIQEPIFEFTDWEDVADVYLAYSHRESVDPRELAREVMRAARENNRSLVEKFVDAGFPINFQEHDTEHTLLHSAAAGSARGVIKFLVEMGRCDFALRCRKGMLASEIAYHVADNYELAQELQVFESSHAETQAPSENDKDLNVDLLFIEMVASQKYRRAIELIDQVGDINVRDPTHGVTALHYAASRSALPLLRHLQERDDLDYLAQDEEGRYPSEMAWHIARNPELGQQLQDLEKLAADERGEKPWPKPAPEREI